MRDIVILSLLYDDHYTHKFIISDMNDPEVERFVDYRKKYQTYI